MITCGKPSTKTSETIHTNKKHPFLTKEKGFLPVGQIKLGMHVLRADGTYGVVTGWKVVPGAEMMYDLEVAQDHTFTVGIQQWVVHNCDISGLANREAQDQVTRLQHTFSEQLDESSLNGTWKELQGESSGYWAKQQREIYHLQKVENALNGAERRVASLQKLVDRGILSESDQCIVQCVINQAGTFIDYVYNTIFSDAWSPGIPPSFP